MGFKFDLEKAKAKAKAKAKSKKCIGYDFRCPHCRKKIGSYESIKCPETGRIGCPHCRSLLGWN